jgi:hypothetical protein
MYKICRQFTTARGLTFQLTNYVPEYTIERNYGLLIKLDEVMTAISLSFDLRGFKLSKFSSLFDLWSLNDTLSCTYPELSKPYLSDIEKLQDNVYLQSLIRDSSLDI